MRITNYLDVIVFESNKDVVMRDIFICAYIIGIRIGFLKTYV